MALRFDRAFVCETERRARELRNVIEPVLIGGAVGAQQKNDPQRFLGAQEVVLIGDDCGGSACGTPHLSPLVLEPGKKPRSFSDDRFVSLDYTENAALNGGVLQVDLGFDGGKRKLARFDGKRLAIVF